MTTQNLTPEQHIMAEQAWQDTQAEAAYQQMTDDNDRADASRRHGRARLTARQPSFAEQRQY